MTPLLNRIPSLHWAPLQRQGKIAAKNIVGIKAEFKAVLNAMVSKIGAMEFGAVGSSKASAMHNGIEVISGKSRALTKARYYPEGKKNRCEDHIHP